MHQNRGHEGQPFLNKSHCCCRAACCCCTFPPYSESIVIIIMIIFNININHWTCDHVVIMWFGWNTTKSLFQLSAISPSVHRILAHSWEIIEMVWSWLGMSVKKDWKPSTFNKLIRQMRTHGARKNSTVNNFEVTGFCISISNAETYTPACLTV